MILLKSPPAEGHLQVLLNKLRGFSPQACLDAPRFCISAGLPDANKPDMATAGDINSEIWFEEGIEEGVVEELKGELASLFTLVYIHIHPPTTFTLDSLSPASTSCPPSPSPSRVPPYHSPLHSPCTHTHTSLLCEDVIQAPGLLRVECR